MIVALTIAKKIISQVTALDQQYQKTFLPEGSSVFLCERASSWLLKGTRLVVMSNGFRRILDASSWLPASTDFFGFLIRLIREEAQKTPPGTTLINELASTTNFFLGFLRT